MLWAEHALLANLIGNFYVMVTYNENIAFWEESSLTISIRLDIAGLFILLIRNHCMI